MIITRASSWPYERVKNFPYIFDTQDTAKLESELDAVEDNHEKFIKKSVVYTKSLDRLS